MLSNSRKKQLKDQAEFTAKNYQNSGRTNLIAILEEEEIPVIFDRYGNSFDGMTIFEGSQFFIHIDIDAVGDKDSGRARFTLAHEIAHVSIDEHRIGLSSKELESHPSRFVLNNSQNRAEEEADYFASCLLMPTTTFKSFCAKQKFSLTLIKDLSEKFQTSILATTIKFAEIGSQEIFVVFSIDNIVKWYVKSEDFPGWPFRFKVGGEVPATTVAGEFYTKKDSKYTGVEDLDPDDWFYPKWDVKSQMHEQCFYSDSYGYVVSLIWFD